MKRNDLPGVDLLREKRGDESVKFSQVADHLFDYAERHAGEAAVVDGVAAFLARVEDVDHDHDADPVRGLG
jgi:hypothetical protein